MRIIFLIFAALLTIDGHAQTQTLPLFPGYLTGNSYVALSPNSRASYATGYVDGALASTMYGAPQSEMQWLVNCTAGMTIAQVTAIFDKWLADNPGRRHEPMNAVAFSALFQTCKRFLK